MNVDDASKLLNLEGIDLFDTAQRPLELASAHVAHGRLIITVKDLT